MIPQSIQFFTLRRFVKGAPSRKNLETGNVLCNMVFYGELAMERVYEEIWQKMLNFGIKINQSHATYVTIQFSC